MYHVAVVENELEFSTQLQKYLRQYQKENHVEFKISVFSDRVPGGKYMNTKGQKTV